MNDIIDRFEAGAIDGFIALPGGSEESMKTFFEKLMPQLVERGLFRSEYAIENNLKILGSPFEIYEVDNRDTILEKEYLTEIQVRVGDQTVKG